MIRYNWSIIKKYSECDMEKIKHYFYNIFINKENKDKYLLKNKYARRIINDSIENNSFIVNIEGLLENSMNATSSEMFVYLDLVSKRDYFTFLNTRKKVNYLPIWRMVDKYDIDKLKTNRLLYITEHNIYFVYEGE